MGVLLVQCDKCCDFDYDGYDVQLGCVYVLSICEGGGVDGECDYVDRCVGDVVVVVMLLVGCVEDDVGQCGVQLVGQVVGERSCGWVCYCL